MTNFKEVQQILKLDNSLINMCPNCGSKDILINEFSPEEKPYVIRTEHTCTKCKYYWYEED